MKAFVVLRRNEHDAFSVRRPARFQVYGTAGCELRRSSAGHIEQPQFHGVFLVGRVKDAFPVRRPIRLEVVARAVGQLRGFFGIERLTPERTRHRINKFVRIWRPRQTRRSAGQLRQIQFTVVIRMGQINLRQDGPALRMNRQRRAQQCAQKNKSSFEQFFRSRPAGSSPTVSPASSHSRRVISTPNPLSQAAARGNAFPLRQKSRCTARE